MKKSEIEKELADSKKSLASLEKSNAPKDEIDFVKDEIKELEEKLKNASEEPSEKKTEKKPVVVRKSPKKSRPNIPRIKPKKKFKHKLGDIKKGKPVTIEYKGKTISKNDPDFCDALVKQLEERRKKRQQAGKSRPKSISTQIGDKMASTVITAVKKAYSENKESIIDTKPHSIAFIKKVEKFYKAADEFANNAKSLLGNDFNKKQFEAELKEIDEFVDKIKKAANKLK